MLMEFGIVPTLQREGVTVTAWEAMAYDTILSAAQAGEVCPMNLDIEMLLDCSSGSVAPSVVKRLERKGLIVVIRFQRFRRVKIVATGQWTARSPSQHVERPHVPRRKASMSAQPSERKHYRKGRL